MRATHTAGSPIPANIWRENGGSFTDFARQQPGAENAAWKGLNPNKMTDLETYDKRMERALVVPADFAENIGASKEIMNEIRQVGVEENAKGASRRQEYL